nr:Mor transcription activator family protein [Acidovorax sp.]
MLEELQAVIARQLEEMGTAPDAASVIGSSAVDYLSTYWAGQVMTFPKDAQYKLTLKELEIYDQFDGLNKDDLARRYDTARDGEVAQADSGQDQESERGGCSRWAARFDRRPALSSAAGEWANTTDWLALPHC